MTLLQGVDVSNLNGMAYRGLPEYQSARFVIAQAIPRPRPNGMVADQLRAAKADGKYGGLYSWLWHDPNWRMAPTVEEDQRLRLATVPDDVQIDMRPWLDEEDNQSDGWRNVSIAQRKDDVLRALDVLSEWGARRGLPQAGIYWSRYFIDLLFGGDDSWLPEGTVQWLAHYMDSRGQPAPGSLIGGNVVAHQYTSDPIDMDMMLESEIVTQSGGTPPVDDAERTALQDKIDGLVNSLGYVAGDLLAPVAKQKSGSKAVQRLVAGIRSQAEQQGVDHA